MDVPRPELSVVVPAYNEAGNIAAIAGMIAEVASELGEWEIVFVNDGSTDATLAEIKRAAARDRRVRFVSLVRNFGHQPALRAGLRYARGAAVVLMDCDLEHPPELIGELVAQWRQGAKVVVTQRTSGGAQHSALKRLTSPLFYRLLGSISDLRIESGSADFLLLDREVVDTINKVDTHDVLLRSFVRWLGYPLAKVEYSQGERLSGETKYTLRRMLSLAGTGIISHSIKPLRLAIYISLVFTGLALLLLVYSIVSFLWISHTVAGWSSIMAVLAILGAGQFLVLGIIGEYVGRVLRETRKWPIYIVAETEQSSAQPYPAAPVRDVASAAR